MFVIKFFASFNIVLIAFNFVSCDPVDKTLENGQVGEPVTEAAIDKLVAAKIFDIDFHYFLQRLALVQSNFGSDSDLKKGGIWQLTSGQLTATKSSKSLPKDLQATYSDILKTIKAKLIHQDWPAVKYGDLKKPLFSAVAVGLHLWMFAKANALEVPVGVSDQFGFFEKSGLKPKNVTLEVFERTVSDHEVKNLNPCPSLSADLFVLLNRFSNGSDSNDDQTAEHFAKRKFYRFADLAVDVINSMNLTTTRVAVAQFDTKTKVMIKFGDKFTHKMFEKRVQSLQPIYTKKPETSHSGLAIKDVLKLFGKSRTNQSMILLLGEHLAEDVAELTAAAKAAAEAKVAVFAVSTAASVKSLAPLADRVLSPMNRVYIVDDVEDLIDLIDPLQRDRCRLGRSLSSATPTFGIVRQGELHYFRHPLSEKGVTLHVRADSGEVEAYYSHSIETPSGVVYDGALKEGARFVPIPDEMAKDVELYFSVAGLAEQVSNYTVEVDIGDNSGAETVKVSVFVFVLMVLTNF